LNNIFDASVKKAGAIFKVAPAYIMIPWFFNHENLKSHKDDE